MMEKEPDKSILSWVVEYKCWLMKSETPSVLFASWLSDLLVVVGLVVVDCGLDKPKLTPNAAWPITSVANLRERLEKVMSSSLLERRS